jgi:hypothetical protein
MPKQYTSLEDCLWSRVDRNGPVPEHRPELGPCWMWTGSVNSYGYGTVALVRFGRRRTGTHRLSWEIHNGPIPNGLRVLHHCDNPPCVRPDHLFVGTQADNMADMNEKRRNGRFKHPESYPVGSSVKQSVLTEEQVVDMRQRRANGEPLIALSQAFGISRTGVKRIVYGHQWKHAEGPLTNPGRPTPLSGERNVAYRKSRERYEVKVERDGKIIRLYGFLTLKEAVAARDAILSKT